MNIPEELRKLSRWVCWRLEERKGKPTKVPVNPKPKRDGTYGMAMSNNPDTWGSYATALECLTKDTTLAGIGFMLGDGYVGVDIDECQEDGIIAEHARDIVSTLDSFTEYSPSGLGLHVICKGKLPEGRRQVFIERDGKPNAHLGIYDERRFFCMTGNVLDAGHMDVEERTDELSIVHEKYINVKKPGKSEQKTSKSVHEKPVFVNDDEIIEKALSAKNGNAFAGLMDGKWKGIYPSTSEADLALCNLLAFWTDRDPVTMDRLFRRSGLYRDKWGERRGEASTYGEVTISKAIDDCREVYTQSRSKKERQLQQPPEIDTGFEQLGKAAGMQNDWEPQLTKDKDGKIYTTISNVLIILQNDSLLTGKIVLNQLLNQMEVCGKLPWGKSSGEFSDTDFNEILYYLEVNYNFAAKSKTESALDIASSRAAYHPIRQYIDSLKWDGKARVSTALIDYLGAEDTPYVRAVTRKTLVAAVARVYQPACKFDYMLVMVGKQDLGKSTFFRKIAGDNFFSDSLKMTDMQSKTGPEKLSGKWILENAELAGARKAEVEDIKSFLSCQSDRYRAAYGKFAKDYPRQCIIVGSTNVEDGFLRDQSGNRRFWPVKVSDKRAHTPWDIDATIRDQIWAEAKHLYDGGETIYLSREQEESAKIIQEEFTEENPYFGPIQEYLECRAATCNLELWIRALGGEKSKYGRAQQLDINACMGKMLGWQRGERERCKGYGRQRTWTHWTEGQ